LPIDVIQRAQEVIRDSIELAINDAAIALPTMRIYAQEFDDEVLMQHVRLYVNDWTRDLGNQGRVAIAELSQRAIAAGLIPHGEKLMVFDSV